MYCACGAVEDMEIRLARPCIEDTSRYIAECHISRKLDIEKLCEILRTSGAMGLKCSVKLGVARFEFGERSVMIYRSGRIDLRRIRSHDEARELLEKIIDMVKDAISDMPS